MKGEERTQGSEAFETSDEAKDPRENCESRVRRLRVQGTSRMGESGSAWAGLLVPIPQHPSPCSYCL